MKQILHIKATIDQPGFLENLVEKLASAHQNSHYRDQKIANDKRTIEVSSTETYVSGTVAMNYSDEQINMPFVTSFLFTCIKENDGHYKLEWGSSLS